MTLDERARRAARDFREAAQETDRTSPGRGSFERFDRYRRRRQRNQRVGSAALAVVVAVAALAVVVRALGGLRDNVPVATPAPPGLIVFNETVVQGGSDSVESFTVRPDGSALTRVGPAGTTSCAGNGDAWNADGKILCLVFGPNLTTATATMNADGSDYAVVSSPRLPDRFGCSGWSPDGTRLLCPYTSDVVYTIRPDGRDLLPLTAIGASEGPSGYTLDGSHAYFSVVDATEHRTLYVVNTDGSGGLTALSPADASVVDNDYFDGVSADSSPDGSQVVFAADVTSSQKALFVARVDGGGSHRIAIPSINPTTAQWSPDGGWIAFAGFDPATNASEVYVIRPDGEGMTAITSTTDGCSSYAPVWSPDGARLLFETQCANGSTITATRLEIASADGSNLTKVTDLNGLTAYAWGA